MALHRDGDALAERQFGTALGDRGQAVLVRFVVLALFLRIGGFRCLNGIRSCTGPGDSSGDGRRDRWAVPGPGAGRASPPPRAARATNPSPERSANAKIPFAGDRAGALVHPSASPARAGIPAMSCFHRQGYPASRREAGAVSVQSAGGGSTLPACNGWGGNCVREEGGMHQMSPGVERAVAGAPQWAERLGSDAYG